jgi:hypothetical protein
MLDKNKLKAENAAKAAEAAQLERDMIAEKAASFAEIKEYLREFARTAAEVGLPIDWISIRGKLGLRKGWQCGYGLFVTKSGKFYDNTHINVERLSVDEAASIFQRRYYRYGYIETTRKAFKTILTGGTPETDWNFR